jgi:hypothetical protein
MFTQPPIQWVPAALSLGVKRPGRKADHSPPSSAEVKERVELYLHSPNAPSWRGAQLKAQRQLYLYLFACYHSVQYLLSSRLISKNLKTKIHETVISPLVLYECETWSLTFRDEHRLRGFENRVLRRISGSKREEDGSWRKLHNDELHSLYCSPNIVRMIKSRRIRWAGHVARMREGRSVYRVLVGRPEGKRPLGRPKRRWEDIRMDLRELGIDEANWIRLAQDRVQWWAFVNTVMNLRVPYRKQVIF